jgi:hypothetical protein
MANLQTYFLITPVPLEATTLNTLPIDTARAFEPFKDPSVTPH